MLSFSIYFLICNIFISVIIGCVLLFKKVAGRHLSGRIQYNLWFLLSILLIVPFIPVRPSMTYLFDFFSSIRNLDHVTGNGSATHVNPVMPSTMELIKDYSISVTREVPSALRYLPSVIWLSGMLAMIFLMIRSRLYLYRIEKSALPLQSQTVKALYRSCRQEIGIKRNIPVYSTAFVKSPFMAGFFRPRIYLPIHLISDLNVVDLRYMLLHELQHYRHRDTLVNCFFNTAAVIYWFNPLIWYTLKEVRTDREIACDSSVLQILDSQDYIAYGHTLINFAEKISFSPFTMATGIGGSARQIKKRILNIVSYQQETKWHKFKGGLVFLLTGILVWESTALVPVLAAQDYFSLPSNATIDEEDLSSFFAGQNGSFVLYDLNADTWKVYNRPSAEKRVSPDSTYKIYSALFALEHHNITPASNKMAWDGQAYPFSEWNQSQNLRSALQNSVTWYFQSLDQMTSMEELEGFFKNLGYGNHDLSGGKSEFWMESSLKISPLEQVFLLKKIYTNELSYDVQNIQAVKDGLFISSSQNVSLYGKTGTGTVNGQNTNGWFVGYLESGENTYFFAANIQGNPQADGAAASDIALDILRRKGLY